MTRTINNDIDPASRDLELTLTERQCRRKGNIALITSALAFSLMSICVKKLDGKIPVTEMVFFRGLISLAITSYQLKLKKVNPWGKNKKLLAIRGLIGTLALYCVFRALGNLSIASATIIQYTYPTFTALGAAIILKERIYKKIGWSIIIGWVGICLVVQPEWGESISFKFSLLEILVALAGAILTSLAYLCVRKLSKGENQLVIIFYFPLVSVICASGFINTFKAPEIIDWIWILGVGLFTQLGQVNITKGLTLFPAAKASSINYSQVFFATIWGYLFFSEKIDILTTIGGLLILSSSLISINETIKEK